ncbi:MAG: hypothetical protein KC464_03245, partial [Myxococcales bacterium]|nr:hypothetical protein [Myxococcales bacterium]
LNRKPEKKKVATTVAEAAAGSRAGSFSVALLAAIVVAVVLVGGFLVYRNMQNDKAKSRGLGKLTAKSAETRPDWASKDTPFSAFCNDTADGGMSCVGVSSPAPTEEDALDEAQEAALEGIANQVAVRIEDPQWKRMASIWAQTRQARMAEYEKDPDSTKTRRAIRDSRKQVTSLLRASAGAAVPQAPTGKYFEEYENADGKRYLYFVEFSLSASELKSMVEQYGHTEKVMGVTVATVFPMVAWRYPAVTKGAVVLGVEQGELNGIGLASGYVVLEVGDNTTMGAVNDAVQFKEVAQNLYDKIKVAGGPFQFRVQANSTEPTMFVKNIPAPKKVEPEGGGSHSGSGGSRPTGPTGPINTWDRVGGSRGGGRDDPTQ